MVFGSVISSGILFLLKELEAACEPSFANMQKTAFGNIETVTEVSPYVTTLIAAIENAVSIVRDNLQPKKYLRNFFDKGAKVCSSLQAASDK